MAKVLHSSDLCLTANPITSATRRTQQPRWFRHRKHFVGIKTRLTNAKQHTRAPPDDTCARSEPMSQLPYRYVLITDQASKLASNRAGEVVVCRNDVSCLARSPGSRPRPAFKGQRRRILSRSTNELGQPADACSPRRRKARPLPPAYRTFGRQRKHFIPRPPAGARFAGHHASAPTARCWMGPRAPPHRPTYEPCLRANQDGGKSQKERTRADLRHQAYINRRQRPTGQSEIILAVYKYIGRSVSYRGDYVKQAA